MTSANVLILLADREMNSSTAADAADWTERENAQMQGALIAESDYSRSP